MSLQRSIIATFVSGIMFLLPIAVRGAAPTTQAKLDAIENEVQRRRQFDPNAAEMLEKDLQHVRQVLAGQSLPNGVADVQVHVIALNMAKYWRDDEIVEVNPSDQPIILVLGGNEPIRWKIKLDEGAKLQRVILAGSDEQKLSWVNPAQASPVDSRTIGRYEPPRFPTHYAQQLRTIESLAKYPVTTSQWLERGTGGPYAVGPGSHSWNEKIVRDELDPLYREATAPARAQVLQEISKLGVFKAVYFDIDAPPANGHPFHYASEVPGVMADFTVAGPIKDTFVSLPWHVVQVAIDPQDPKTWYGQGDNDIFRIGKSKSPQTLSSAKLQRSGIAGIAFDTKRRRLVVAGHEGTMAYSPEKDEWSFVSAFPDRQIMLQGIVYSADDDCFFAMRQDWNDPTNTPTIYRLTPDFTVISQVDCDRSVDAVHMPFGRRQLSLMGRNLAVVTPPTQGDDGEIAGPGHCMIVDPQTGAVLLDRVLKPHAATVEELAPGQINPLWQKIGRSDAQALQASEQLIAAGDKAIDNSQSQIETIVRDASTQKNSTELMIQVLVEIGTPDAVQELIKLSPGNPEIRKVLREL